MATLKVLCGVMWFAIAGGVPTQEKSLEITLDMLNRKLTAMQSQGTVKILNTYPLKRQSRMQQTTFINTVSYFFRENKT